jgi:hypothetical protein
MRRIAARFTKILVLLTLALAVTASGGSAASRLHPGILGVVPHMNPPAHAVSKAVGAAGPATLTFDANYETLINRYFADVAHDSGGTQNVYSVATQYTDDTGNVTYQSTFGGPYVAHDPLPPSGCDDGADPYCLTNQQLEEEIQTVLDARHWQGGLDHMFFLMTPNGVGSCEFGGPVSDANPCSTKVFCAYHSFYGLLNNPVIYANEPYLGPSPGCTDPNTQGFPNNDVDAETTINTISHEHNEAITDPLLDAWIAADDNENGDLCAYGFGTQLGGTGSTAYNQVINGHHYELQQEWSNQAPVGCAQFLGGPATPATTGAGPLANLGSGQVMHTNTTYAIYWLPRPGNTTAPVVTGTATVNQTLTTSAGAWTGGPSGFHYQWQRCTGTTCVNVAGATAGTYKLTSADGGHSVRSVVTATNVNGASTPAAAAPTAVVIDVPAATKLPHVSGRTRAGKKLSGSHGSWTYSPTSYRLQWLRCNAQGAHCSSIRHATHATYKLTKRDARHRLRLRVTATNAAGRTTAVSKATARVPALKRR